MLDVRDRSSIPPVAQGLAHKKEQAQRTARDSSITALVLGLLSLFLLAAAFVLFGLGTLSPTHFMGLGIFPYLGGTLLSFVALGVVLGMVIFAARAAVHSCRKEQFQALLQLSA